MPPSTATPLGTPSPTVGVLEALIVSALDAIRQHGLAPTPRAFQSLFEYFSAPRTDLSITELVERIRSGAQDDDEPASQMEAVEEGASMLENEAGRLMATLTGTGTALTRYGSVLDGCTRTLDPTASAALLMQSVALLNQETARMSARNAALEEELRASTTRVGKLRQRLAAVRQEACVDVLTGVANRRAFAARLKRELTSARSDEAAPFCLVLLDIDHFKRFNDTHGHRTGDRVLRLVAQMLTENVKGRDFVARYGGEEFVLLLGDVDAETGASITRQICARLAARRLVKRETAEEIGTITLSAGVAQVRASDSQGTLLERADAALYAAKHNGRNQVLIG